MTSLKKDEKKKNTCPWATIIFSMVVVSLMFGSVLTDPGHYKPSDDNWTELAKVHSLLAKAYDRYQETGQIVTLSDGKRELYIKFTKDDVDKHHAYAATIKEFLLAEDYQGGNVIELSFKHDNPCRYITVKYTIILSIPMRKEYTYSGDFHPIRDTAMTSSQSDAMSALIKIASYDSSSVGVRTN